MIISIMTNSLISIMISLISELNNYYTRSVFSNQMAIPSFGKNLWKFSVSNCHHRYFQAIREKRTKNYYIIYHIPRLTVFEESVFLL